LSFTREVSAQTAPSGPAPERLPAPAAASPEPGRSTIVYNSSVDRLDALFPTGVVATLADRSITVADVRRYVAPLIPKLQRDASNQDEFNAKLTLLQNSAVKDLVARMLLIRQFHDQKAGEQAKQIPAVYVDTSIADSVKERFEGDRSKFLAHLRERNLTLAEYRKEVEEDIIYNYMRSQERKLAGTVTRPIADRDGPRIRLRIIQLTRLGDDTDAALLEKASAILARFRNGESFESLAREFDQSGRADRGGDWGWQGPTDLRVEYRDTVMALNKGEVTAPILAKDACLLLYAEDRR